MGKIRDLLKSSLHESESRTSEDHDHYHTFEVNAEGNGKTDKTIGEVEEHIHEIEEYEVQEANGHTHSIPKKTPKINEKD